MTIYSRFKRASQLYADKVREHARRRQMERIFGKALANHEFCVWYQPKHDMRTGEICGAEALVRWEKENGEIISPAQFIPEFEKTGQIIALDEEVLRIVCRDIREAKKEGTDMSPVSVNLSKVNILGRETALRIRRITQECDIRAGELSFEITESTAVSHDKEDMDELVDSLHEMGFQVDMDDYGTGSSTLKSLADTHFDTLKLDRSFISLIGSPKMDTIVRSTIHMVEELHMNVVAEGVETQEQVKFLLENQCFTAQGYYFSRPLTGKAYRERRAHKQREGSA